VTTWVQGEGLQATRRFTWKLGAAIFMPAALVVGVGVGLLGPLAAWVPIGLVGIAWATFRAPGVLLGAFLLIPYYKASIGGLFPVDLTVLLALINGFQLAVMAVTGFRYRGSRALLVLWLLLGILVLAGVAWAGDQSVGLSLAAMWWALVLVPSAAAIRVASESRFVNQFLATMLIAGVAIVVVGVPGLLGDSRLRLFGENTIQTGQITLIVAIIAAAWFVRVGPPAAGWVVVLVVPLAFIESIATGSRGPILAIGVVLIAAALRALVVRRRLSGHDLRIALVGGAAVAALALAIDRLPGEALARFARFGAGFGSGGTVDTSIGAREELFALAGRLFLDRPVVGTGTGGFAAYAQSQAEFTAHFYPHNDALQVAAEFGILGLVLFGAFVTFALVRRIADEPRWWTIRWLALFMLVNSLVSGDVYTDRLFWGLLVILIAAPAIASPAGSHPTDATHADVPAIRAPSAPAPI
jgi:hypothetical protein